MADLTWHRTDTDGTVRFRSAGHVPARVLRTAYENRTGFDVELFGTAAADEDPDTLQPIRAHKLIMINASKHLHELFTVDDYIDSHQKQYKFTEISHESLADIVKFIYTDELNFPADCAPHRMQQVSIGAKFLLMPDLVNACETYLASDTHLTLKNCMCMLLFARKYACLSLLDAVLTLAARNLPYFTNDSNFLNLNQEAVSKLLLSEPVITIATADHRCRAAIAWLNHDRASRDTCISDVLNTVPFDLNLISPATLGAAASNTAIRAKYAEKLMSAIFDGVKKYERDEHYYSPNRSVLDVWWNENTTRNFDKWYVIGGVHAQSKLIAYDVQRRCWETTLPDLPWKRTDTGACVVGERTLFLFGGRKNNQNSADIDWCVLSSEGNNTWNTPDALKLCAARSCLSACVRSSDEVSCFAFGGFPADTNDAADKFSGRISAEDGKLWLGREHMPKMSVGRYNAPAVCVGDAAFIFGGNRDDLGALRLSSIEKFDCTTSKWASVGNMGAGRSSLMAALLSNDDVYLAGGWNGVAGVDVVEVFNTRTGQTRQERSMLSARVGGSGVALDRNTFCVIGGSLNDSDSACLASVECFDVREGKWSTGSIVPDMPTANRNFAFASV